MYQALYRKYRPRTFDDVVGQEHITDILRSQVSSGRLSHAYLFTGTRGTGKTTCAKILSKAANCLHPVNGSPCNQCAACVGIDNGSIMDVVEIDAASNNGVDNIRSLRDEAVFTPANAKMRVYIVDEVHMLSGSAFNALLKILEEPPGHLMFILATTEVHKVPATVASRCQRFAFKRLSPQIICDRLLQVAQAEHIRLAPDAAALLASMADGAMRDALSLLDQCSCSGGDVTLQSVYDSTGMAGRPGARELLFAACEGRTKDALDAFDRLYYGGADVTALLDELSTLCRNMLIYKAVYPDNVPGSYALSGEETEEALKLGTRRMMDVLSLLRECQSRARVSTDRRIDAQLCILNISSGVGGEDSSLLQRVQRLEERLDSGSFALPAVKSVPVVNQPAPVQKQPAAVPKEDLPPWDVSAPEPPKAWPEPAPIQKAPAPAQPPLQPKEAPAPKAVKTLPQSDEGFDWSRVLAGVKDKLSFSDFTNFQMPSMMTAAKIGDSLYLNVKNPFLSPRLEDTRTQAVLKEAAGVRFLKINEPVPTAQPNKPAGSGDKFSKLLSIEGKFDQIQFE